MRRRAAAIITTLFGIALSGAGAAAVRADCGAHEPVAVAQTRPDGTFRLADGREGKLAGTVLSGTAGASFRTAMRAPALSAVAVGRPDRWGRQAFHIERVEQDLIRQGLGHAARQAEGACLAPLLAAEAEARAARRGIWSGPGPVLAASNGAALQDRLGQHVLVEGSVVSARRFGGRVYLNFARYWKSGLSLIIAEKQWPIFSGGAEPETFGGKRVRVRGRLDWRGGPVVVARPDDRVELAD